MSGQLVEETLRYGPNSLQTITVATVPNGPATGAGLWVVYVCATETTSQDKPDKLTYSIL